jgi:hypothetical protein
MEITGVTFSENGDTLWPEVGITCHHGYTEALRFAHRN